MLLGDLGDLKKLREKRFEWQQVTAVLMFDMRRYARALLVICFLASSLTPR